MIPSFVTWLWDSPVYRTKYHIGHVNAFFRMIGLHYKAPHRKVLVTEPERDLTGLAEGVELHPLPATPYPDYGSPDWPNCFARLAQFKFGWPFEFTISLDLDCIIVDDISPLVDKCRPNNLTLFGVDGARMPINGSFIAHKANQNKSLWDDFTVDNYTALRNQTGWRGSDQSWIAGKTYFTNPDTPRLGTKDGMYSYRVHFISRYPTVSTAHPPCIYFFNGLSKPWDEGVYNNALFKGNYPIEEVKGYELVGKSQ